MNILFFIDVILTFNCAVEITDLKINDDRSFIAKEYLKGWFWVDILTILPFDLLFQGTNYNTIARFFRIGRLYRLVRLTKLQKILGNILEHSKLIKKFMEFLNIGEGV
jgi:hypothetical protein